MPAFTFFATAGSVRLVGAKPVFADIEEGSFNIDGSSLESLVSDKTRAIIPVDLFGQPANLSEVVKIAKDRGLKVIDDAAQAIGAEHKNQKVGSICDLTTFSFYPTKNLGACGEGGLVTTNDSNLAEKLRQLRNHGQSSRYEHAYVGLNARLSAIQAAILRIKLRHLEEWTAVRQAHAQKYRELLSDRKDLVLPPLSPATSCHVYNQFVVRVKERDRVRESLTAEGIGTGVYYPIPLHLQPCFQELGYAKGDLPVSEKACEEVLALPCYPELDSSKVERVAATLKRLCD